MIGMVVSVPASIAQSTAKITPLVSTYAASGGFVTFTVTMNESEPMTALGFSVVAPKGWAFRSLGGVNLPAAAPQAGDEGELGFAYVEVPPGQATFMFTLTYPAGLSGRQELTAIQAIFRPASGKGAQQVRLPDVILGPDRSLLLSGRRRGKDYAKDFICRHLSPARILAQPRTVSRAKTSTALPKTF